MKMHRLKNLRWFALKEKGMRRYFAHYIIGGDYLREIDTHLEVVWRKPRTFGFNFHLGDKGSETPIDIMLDLGFIIFFWGLNFPGLGELCSKIGRGHKRDIGLQIHHGSLWWKLWYNDDGGWDAHHRCDSWRKPIWPWSMGRKKHRPWMCLRQGNIELNPLDAIWGYRYFDREVIDHFKGMVEIGEFEGDEYEVEFKLEKNFRQRRYGPKLWVRRRTFEGYSADWTTKGIPFRNHSWKGDDVLASSEPLTGGNISTPPKDWKQQAIESLVERIKKDRDKYKYHPPQEAIEKEYHE